MQCRSSHRRCSVTKGILKNLAKFTGKHLCGNLFFLIKLPAACNFIKKVSNTGVFLRILPCFQEHLFYRPPPGDYCYRWLYQKEGKIFFSWMCVFCLFFSFNRLNMLIGVMFLKKHWELIYWICYQGKWKIVLHFPFSKMKIRKWIP